MIYLDGPRTNPRRKLWSLVRQAGEARSVAELADVLEQSADARQVPERSLYLLHKAVCDRLMVLEGKHDR